MDRLGKSPGAVFTVGHSTHSIEVFIKILKQNGVTAIADVRSSPYSRYTTQFNREALEQVLLRYGIAYVFLGKELGARSSDPNCYEDGRVQFSKLAKTDLFQAGIARVIKGAQTHRIALMCAEKEPFECHRMLLVGSELFWTGHPVVHLHANGDAEPHASTVQRLIDHIGLANDDLFRSPEATEMAAIEVQAQRIAHVDEDMSQFPFTGSL